MPISCVLLRSFSVHNHIDFMCRNLQADLHNVISSVMKEKRERCGEMKLDTECFRPWLIKTNYRISVHMIEVCGVFKIYAAWWQFHKAAIVQELQWWANHIYNSLKSRFNICSKSVILDKIFENVGYRQIIFTYRITIVPFKRIVKTKICTLAKIIVIKGSSYV